MRIRKKEACIAVILSISMIMLVFYSDAANNRKDFLPYLTSSDSRGELAQSYGLNVGGQTYTKVILENIEGELDKGTFESVVIMLEVLAEEMDGYVKSLYMTYKDEVWSGRMVCKVPTANVTLFTFDARKIIDANGTVTFISINMETVEVSQENSEAVYSTINISLREISSEKGENKIVSSIGAILPYLATALVWIAQALIIGVPLSFASLGIVILVNRGILPLWKNILKKPKPP